MSTTVTYKGNTIATVNNNTKTLKTAGKYMEDDVTLVDVSSGASAISVIDELDVHGGTIRHINAVDLSNDTVTAAHLEYGYTAHNSQGEAITGELVPGSGTQAGTVTQDVNGFLILDDEAGGGGGSSGLVYETGTFTPSENIASPTISFANTHTDPPIIVNMTDTGDGFTPSANAMIAWQYYDPWKLTGYGFPYNTTSGVQFYAIVQYTYLSTSGSIGGGRLTCAYDSSQAGSGQNYPSYFANTTRFVPYGSTSRYWLSGRTYKWIAVWAPTT